jgi:hypothetical protein
MQGGQVSVWRLVSEWAIEQQAREINTQSPPGHCTSAMLRRYLCRWAGDPGPRLSTLAARPESLHLGRRRS